METVHGRRVSGRVRGRTIRFAGPSRRRLPLGTLLLVVLLTAGCRTVGPPVPPPAPPADGWTEEGVASWYGHPFHGRTTASGEVYDMEAMTAAHQELPFGTVVHVQNLDNGRAVTLRINDRGPFVGRRVLDVSRRAARELDMIGPGTARVRITVVEAPAPITCFHVQAASFRSRSNAREMARRLEAEGVEARVERASRRWHRVMAGPFPTRSAANELASRLDGLVLTC
jgi:rare lipoprotein A